ncbi:MAG TPA: hypothetical protein VHX38_11680 [Pseudonocardiaceae bacterium]|jgi:hypothetical protein|nr:hypothetical protein [Pseudonocardiaceae bacterium]
MEPNSIGEFTVFADYNMFFLLADMTEVPHLNSGFIDRLLTDLIAAAPGAVIVGTARRMEVPVNVCLCPEVQEGPEDTWDHVAEASIRTDTGIIHLVGDASNPDDDISLTIPPGTYRVRVCSSGFDTLSEDGLDGDDQYRLVLWPAAAQPARVVKRYPKELPGG